MDVLLSQFKITVSAENDPRIGVIQHKSGLTVFVVPRFWFDSQQHEPQIISDERPWVVVPDRTKDWENVSPGFWAYLRSKSEIAQKLTNQLRVELEWGTESIRMTKIPMTDAEETEQESGRTEEARGEALDSQRLRGLFHLLWWTHPKSFDRFIELFAETNLQKNDHLLHEAFVSRIEHRLTELRRTYKKARLNSSLIKGRIDIGRSAMALAYGLPVVHSTYNDFSLKSDHYAALMTALDLVVTHHTSKPEKLETIGSGFTSDFDLGERAAKLRSRFREIPSVRPQYAFRTLSRGHLPPQLALWRPIFQLGAAIIAEKSGLPRTEGGGRTRQEHIQMSKIWEKILAKSAIKFVDGEEERGLKFLEQKPMRPPWNRSGSNVSSGGANNRINKNPDLTVWNGEINDRALIIDAKYTDSLGPRSYDQQTLMYAMIDWANPPEERATESDLQHQHRRVVLVHPTLARTLPEDTTTDGGEATFTEEPDKVVEGETQELNIGWLNSKLDVSLTKYTLGLPFPSPNEVLTWASRERFLERRKADVQREWSKLEKDITKRFTAPEQEQTQLKSPSIRQD